jgi:hypothetical protein
MSESRFAKHPDYWSIRNDERSLSTSSTPPEITDWPTVFSIPMLARNSLDVLGRF